MIAGVVLEVGIQQFVARPDHQGGTQLEGSATALVLAMSGRQAASPGRQGGRLGDGNQSEPSGSDEFGSQPIFVEEHVEGYPLIFNERLGITLATGSNGDHGRPCRGDLFISVADLTGPLAAGQSAKVPEEQDHGRRFRPPVTEAMLDPLGVDQHVIS